MELSRPITCIILLFSIHLHSGPVVISSSQKQGNLRLSQFGGHELPPAFDSAGSQDIQERILKKT